MTDSSTHPNAIRKKLVIAVYAVGAAVLFSSILTKSADWQYRANFISLALFFIGAAYFCWLEILRTRPSDDGAQ